MKTFKTTTLLGAACAVLLATGAVAANNKAVVDSAGQVVKSIAHKNCVITKWEGIEGCGEEATSEMRTVYFDFDSAVLTPAAKAKLDVLADVLKGNGVKAVNIVGFADFIGNASYNQGLSQRRANAVSGYLAGKGIALGATEVRGLGATSSRSQCAGVKGNELKACLWRDRRVEVELIK